MTLALQFIVPGIFGFLIWEFKENWKLYEANRPRDLRPVIVGNHGETMARLLRPGFHSGTIPKLFAKLRRAERKASLGSRRLPSPSRKYRDKLNHVEESVRFFVCREFLALLNLSRSLAGEAISLDAVCLGTNRVCIRLKHQGYPDQTLVIAFEDQSGWLVAGVSDAGWLPELSVPERATVRDALAGFYKLSGVDLVREQIEAQLGPGRHAYDVMDSGLVVWTDSLFQTEVIVDLRGNPPVSSDRSPPVLSGQQSSSGTNMMVYSQVPLDWTCWVEVWEFDRDGPGHRVPAVPGIRLLPGPETVR